MQWSLRRNGVVLLIFGTVLGAGCVESTPPEDSGSTEQAHRIVALAPNLAEIIADLGEGGRLEGISSYGRVPPGARRAKRVGGFIDPSIEQVIALRPDLVVGVPLQRAALEGCRAAGLRVVEIPCQTVDETFLAYRSLGRLMGVSDKATRAVERLQRRLERVRRLAAQRPHPRTLMLLGHAGEDLREVFPVAPGTFTHELLVLAGGRNVLDRATVSIGVEAIIQARPEVILEVAMDERGEGGERLLPPSPLWARLPDLPAVREGRVYRVESASLLQPGPALADGAELLYRLLHSEPRGRDGGIGARAGQAASER